MQLSAKTLLAVVVSLVGLCETTTMSASYGSLSGLFMDEHETADSIENEGWEAFHERYLKDKETSGRLDFSVLSVGVMTLGLILVVEVLRHRLDHAAEGRPYFTAVLENIYAELTTLGIVEFCVFLLQEYHTTMDKEKKDVFGAVHFALFYTAIFNAFQSVVLCFISTRVSHRMWVQTEALELNHYVEVREEFERVELALKNNRSSSNQTSSRSLGEGSESVGPDETRARSAHPDSKDYHSEYVFEASWKGIISLFGKMGDLLRYPQLTRRYNQLLLQVRFHELRVHFLEANNLPAKLEVSDYLSRCEKRLLIKMAHVSAAAWLLLTASINVLYFLMGIVATDTEDKDIVGVTLAYIFFCSMGLFVIMALVVYNKMKGIFATIMHREDFWDAEHQDDETRENLAEEQRNLFWFGSPSLVITALQFMQFGYAISLSAVIMFWEDIDDGDLSMIWYWITIIVCYALFVHVAAEVVPRYTMCTSLGQLVDKKRLDATVANFHLEEAKRHRVEESYFHAYHEAHNVEQIICEKDEKSTIPNSLSATSLSSMGSEQERTLVGTKSRRESRQRQKAVSDGVAFMASMKDENRMARDDLSVSTGTDLSTPRRSRQNSSGVESMASTGSGGNRSEQIAMYVRMDTRSLRRNMPEGETPKSRPRRQKSLSDGVKAMSSFNKTTTGEDASTNEKAEEPASVASKGNITVVNNLHIPEHEAHSAQQVHVTIGQKMRSYFSSQNYRVSSHVFGTMVAFFLVGLRVEKFLHSEGILPDYFITFGLAGASSFWLLSGWMVMFLFGDVLIFLVTLNSEATQHNEKVLRIAAMVDFVISSVCLVVFWSAEVRRCCYPDEESQVVVEDTSSPYSDPAPCSCPTFGSRTYSGLGRLEPFVSLISLRLFRFLIAKKILKRFAKASLPKQLQRDPAAVELGHFHKSVRDTPTHEKAETHDHDSHGHGHGHSKGTAAELWEAVLSKHPEVAEKYGVFSSEMLQLMLGIPLMHEDDSDLDTRDPQPGQKSNYALESKYSSLSPGAQEIIMAGKLGKDVHCIENGPAGEPVVTIPEEDLTEENPKSYVFELAEKASVPPQITMADEMPFDVPNATLVHSMRRCDRKVLPVLDKWSVVDVILTRFEIVYVDASDFVSGPHSEAAREALMATCGGKGLRLSDVVVGRKVVGHLRLSEISSMAVERYLPKDEIADPWDTPEVAVPGCEFWKGEVSQWLGPPLWNGIRQDTLAIHTKAGNTLYLRFYADYEEAEKHPDRFTEDCEENNIHRNNSFQWAQTIGRICGPEQLRQSLPHFGDDTDDELRDYLIVHQEGEQTKNSPLLAVHGPHMRHTDAVSSLARKSTREMRSSSTQRMKHTDATSNYHQGSMRSLSPGSPRRGSVRSMFRSSSTVKVGESDGSDEAIQDV